MNTDGLNPFTVLLFVGAVLGGGALAATYLFARLTKREPLGRVALRVLAAGVAVYVVLLVIASVSSRSRVLAPGEAKHICEVDCHLAYSVVGAKHEALSDGRVRYTVTVNVLFDKETISQRRPLDAQLSPNARYVALVDAEGHRYEGSTEGLRRRLIPGESYTTDLSFDVPAGAQQLRLILRNNDAETPFIIGHENSFFHGETTFALPKDI